jgi:hypothetical protein
MELRNSGKNEGDLKLKDNEGARVMLRMDDANHDICFFLLSFPEFLSSISKIL